MTLSETARPLRKKSDPGLLASLFVVLLGLVAACGGGFVWMITVMGSAGCMSGDRTVWACTESGEFTIACIIPVMSLVAVVYALMARRRWKYVILQPEVAIPLAWLIVLGSWGLSISLMMTSSS